MQYVNDFIQEIGSVREKLDEEEGASGAGFRLTALYESLHF